MTKKKTKATSDKAVGHVALGNRYVAKAAAMLYQSDDVIVTDKDFIVLGVRYPTVLDATKAVVRAVKRHVSYSTRCYSAEGRKKADSVLREYLRAQLDQLLHRAVVNARTRKARVKKQAAKVRHSRSMKHFTPMKVYAILAVGTGSIPETEIGNGVVRVDLSPDSLKSTGIRMLGAYTDKRTFNSRLKEARQAVVGHNEANLILGNYHEEGDELSIEILEFYLNSDKELDTFKIEVENDRQAAEEHQNEPTDEEDDDEDVDYDDIENM